MFKVDIYIETSIKGPGKRDGWCAALLEYRSKHNGLQTREDFELLQNTTYYKSVLTAILKSLKRLNTNCDVIIHTDCGYVRDMVEKKVLKQWQRNGFINAEGKDVANKEEWKQFGKLINNQKVTFVCEKRNSYSRWLRDTAERRFHS